MRIDGQTAVITGGSRGIGLAIAEELVRRGARVILWARHPERLREAAARLEALGGEARTQVVDVSDRAAVYRAAAELEAAGERVDILVNNAGVISGRPLLELADEQIEHTMQVNALAHFWTVKAFLPGMVARDHGHLVTVASAAGIMGVNRMGDYAASKFAAFGLDESLRLELRRLGSKVGTTVVCPFFVDTGMFHGVRSRVPWLLPILKTRHVARRAVHGLARGRRRVVMPPAVYLVFLFRLLPVALFDAIASLLGVTRAMDTFEGRGDAVPLPRSAETAPRREPPSAAA